MGVSVLIAQREVPRYPKAGANVLGCFRQTEVNARSHIENGCIEEDTRACRKLQRFVVDSPGEELEPRAREAQLELTEEARSPSEPFLRGPSVVETAAIQVQPNRSGSVRGEEERLRPGFSSRGNGQER